MEAHKRKPRAYKISDKHYIKAMKRAKNDKKQLATLIESWVVIYGEGFTAFYRSRQSEITKEPESNKK